MSSTSPFTNINNNNNNNNNELYYDYSMEPFQYSGQFPSTISCCTHPPFPVPPPLTIPGGGMEYEPASALGAVTGGYTSSGCSSYGGSPTSITSYNNAMLISPSLIMQRSISSHSLHNNSEAYSPMNSSPRTALFEMATESSSFRKVSSTGDLQGMNMTQQNQRQSSPLANEISIIESMNRASPYSPEEKRERIERYKSKRNLRNFNKKIKYECRKTLADSRPRIRGRFARNDEIEKAPQSQWDHHHVGIEEDDEDEDNWIHFLDPYSANLMP